VSKSPFSWPAARWLRSRFAFAWPPYCILWIERISIEMVSF